MADVNHFDRDYFERLYANNPDPWNFRTSAYEEAKYSMTMDALFRPRYSHVLELGCSIGELTRRLADRADEVTAVDTSGRALAVARSTCAAATNVRFVQAHLPEGHWEGTFDLVVLSEILYYLDAASLTALSRRIVRYAPRADMVMVHWTGETNYPLSGDDAVTLFLQDIGRPESVETIRTPQYRLDRLRGKPS